MTEKKPWPKKTTTPTTKPKLRTKKKPSSTSGAIGAAKAKRASSITRVTETKKTLAAARERNHVATESSRLRSSIPAPGSSSANSSKGALGKLKARKGSDRTSRSGIALGDIVVCTWIVDAGYGGGTQRFKGRVVDIRPDASGKGDFFTLRDKQGVELDYYTPMCKLKVI